MPAAPASAGRLRRDWGWHPRRFLDLCQSVLNLTKTIASGLRISLLLPARYTAASTTLAISLNQPPSLRIIESLMIRAKELS